MYKYPACLILIAFLLSLLPASPAIAAEFAQQTQITASVQVQALNVRSGPGTNYSRVGGVKRGDLLTVLGQVQNCAWLQVRTAQNLDGWVAGSTRYVKSSTTCADVPAVSLPTAAVTTAPASTSVAQAAPAATPAPTATSAPASVIDPANPPAWLAPGVDPGRAAELEAKVPLRAGMACVLFQNFMGGNLQLALNNHKEDAPYSIDLLLSGGEERAVCLPPGLYFFKLSTPRYNSLQDSIRFYPDTRDVFSVRGN